MYRGRPRNDAPELDLQKIRRWGFMMRSFFGVQEGVFEVGVRVVGGYHSAEQGGDKVDEWEGGERQGPEERETRKGAGRGF